MKLKAETEEGSIIEALFSEEKGMSLAHYRIDGIDLLDPAHLGTVIGPHYRQRLPSLIPHLSNPSAFSHIAQLQEEGYHDPFPYGVARYVAWETEQSKRGITAHLQGEEKRNGESLRYLEGQGFQLFFRAELSARALCMQIDVVSDKDSLVGFAHAFRLKDGKGELVSDVANYFLSDVKEMPLPAACRYDASHRIHLDLSQEHAFTFHPYTDKTKASIFLTTEEYGLEICYECTCQENAWQVVRPKKHPYVLLRYVSAKYPTRPNLTVSGLKLTLRPSKKIEEAV